MCIYTYRERDNVVYWKTKGKINNDLQCLYIYLYAHIYAHTHVCKHIDKTQTNTPNYSLCLSVCLSLSRSLSLSHTHTHTHAHMHTHTHTRVSARFSLDSHPQVCCTTQVRDGNLLQASTSHASHAGLDSGAVWTRPILLKRSSVGGGHVGEWGTCWCCLLRR